MDISGIDIGFIKEFGSIYTAANKVFGADPAAASAKQQKKIRKWIEKNYFADRNYPEEVMHFIGKKVSNEGFFEYLKACHEQIQSYGTQAKQSFDESSAGLTDEVKRAVLTLLENYLYFGNIRKSGNDALINVDYGGSYDRTLTLINASGIPEGKTDWLSFENGSLIKQDDEYILNGEAEDDREGLMTPFAIRFSDARVDITLFRADEQMYGGTPWMYLKTVASDILDKYALSSEYLNDREKELLPLIAEIGKLSDWTDIPDELRFADFSGLKSYIVEFGYGELLPLIESLEKDFYSDNKKHRIIKKLISKLNTQRYEPLWRELRDTIAESQSSYPSKAAVCCPAGLLNETRSNLQKLMESHGYSGKYPDFVKEGAIRGIRPAVSYDSCYFIGYEKRAMYYIHCTEDYFGEQLTVQFICGTEFLRKDETAGDVYSCLFNAKGRRLFRTVSYQNGHINPDEEFEADGLERRVQIAVKNAELIKLTKEEREETVGFNFPYWKLFLFAFIVLGGLSGIFMAIGFMLMTVVACLVLGQPQTIPSMLKDYPWGLILLLSWVLFGGFMGILTVFVKKNNI